ncbi:MAG: metal-sulfur cluster biosynthetic enzyme, partial [Frankiales bacterium]|nr:metal-sulfur cluster biosynthetic enzyme [Frankiales bacterium]
MSVPLLQADVLSAVTAALSTVRDPELDESIVDLGFVRQTSVVDGHAEVRLRLPTYFCAPNFAYLMVADA